MLGIFGKVILDGGNAVIDKQFFAIDITGKAADPIIHGDDVGVEAVDQIVERL